LARAVVALTNDRIEELERELERKTYALRQAYALLVADEAIEAFNGSTSPTRTTVLEQVSAALEERK
jgi:hypothetical protein